MTQADFDYGERIDAERNYFGLCWPNHCRTCGGWGQHSWYERHDAGYPGEQMTEPCGDCTASVQRCGEPERCARCAEPGLDPDGRGPCRACGWDYDDGMPEY